MKSLTQNEIKKKIGHHAASLVQDGMLIGLGTGSTASFFIESLSQRCRDGLKILAVASSNRSMQAAKMSGIPLISETQFISLDLTIDGTDEIDPAGRMVKGGGGALTREKILATSSKRLVIIVDESKLVPTLGHFGVAIEVLFFAFQATISKIEKLGYAGKLRLQPEGTTYQTDNGNVIFDIHYPKTFMQPEIDHEKISQIAGVVETGFFFNLSLELLIGHGDGTITQKKF